jgi:hypothetical protein
MLGDTGFFNQDVGKIAFNRETSSYYFLNIASPPNWKWIGGGMEYSGEAFDIFESIDGLTGFTITNADNGGSSRTGFQLTNNTPTTANCVKLSSGLGGYVILTNPEGVKIGASLGNHVHISDQSGNFGYDIPDYASAVNTGYAWIMDGTNAVLSASGLSNASTSTQTGFSSDTYLSGSTVTISSGADWKQRGKYHCVFDMAKTAAGSATPIIIVRMGTAGTTSDSAICTLTFSVGSNATDSGLFEVNATFRSVGSGTSAVLQTVAECRHVGNTIGGPKTGLVTAGAIEVQTSTSSGFNSTTPTKIGVSFNGGTSFSGTCTLVQSDLKQSP